MRENIQCLSFRVCVTSLYIIISSSIHLPENFMNPLFFTTEQLQDVYVVEISQLLGIEQQQTWLSICEAGCQVLWAYAKEWYSWAMWQTYFQLFEGQIFPKGMRLCLSR